MRKQTPPFSNVASQSQGGGIPLAGCGSTLDLRLCPRPLVPPFPQEGGEVAVEVGQTSSPGVSGCSVFLILLSVLLMDTSSQGPRGCASHLFIVQDFELLPPGCTHCKAGVSSPAPGPAVLAAGFFQAWPSDLPVPGRLSASSSHTLLAQGLGLRDCHLALDSSQWAERQCALVERMPGFQEDLV